MRIPIIMLVSTFFLLNSTSCGNDKVKYTDLEGNWEIIQAKRNDRATQTLENVYFSFSSESKMETNIFGEKESFPVEFKESSLRVESSKIKEILVKELRNDTLFLQTRIGDFRFDLDMYKTSGSKR